MRFLKRKITRMAAPRHGRRRRCGFTLAEMMISVMICSFVMVMTADLQLMTARSAKKLYGETRTRSSRMRALDQIRFRLANAERGSCVITPNQQRIEFTDPVLGGSITSAFFFVVSQRTLYYDEDISVTGAEPVVVGPINVIFDLQDDDAVVWMKVTSASDAICGDVDTQDGLTAIYLKNTPTP